MAKNELLVKRVAVGNFTFPTQTATSHTLSAYVTGAFLPKGAIVTGLRCFSGGTITNVANMKDATFNLVVGGQTLGTNDRIFSVAFSSALAMVFAVSTADGVFVSVGGPLVIHIASSDAARTGIAGNADVYVEYLYVSDRDLS